MKIAQRTAQTKKCPKCKKRFPTTNFYRHNGYKDSLYYLCKPCACAQARERRRRKPEVYRAINKRSNDKNKGKYEERIKAYNRNERKKLPSYPIILKNMRVRGEARRKQLRAEMILEYGSKCACCGESTWEFLTLDHVNGDGAKHRKEMNRSGVEIYALLKKQGWPKDRYRLLCMNCNFAIGRCGYCPHTVKEGDRLKLL